MDMKIGIDIGGTKCAVVLGNEREILKRIEFPTTTCEETLANILKTVEEIGEALFDSCESLMYVTLPQNLDTLPTRTFQNCALLAIITLPDSIRVIEENVFYSCASLGRVDLPKSLIKIGKESFFDCPSLSKVVYPYSAVRFMGVTVEEGNDELFAALQCAEVE
jgi:hypothetical protein